VLAAALFDRSGTWTTTARARTGSVKKYVNLALKTALECTTHRHRLGAVVVKSGRVFAHACNRNGVHAEVRALKKLRPEARVGTTVYVARLPRENKPSSMAKPCPDCQVFLVEAGVKKVVYTDFTSNTQTWAVS
jgi:pyrimidine deaminase RibD-like protein